MPPHHRHNLLQYDDALTETYGQRSTCAGTPNFSTATVSDSRLWCGTMRCPPCRQQRMGVGKSASPPDALPVHHRAGGLVDPANVWGARRDGDGLCPTRTIPR